MFMLKLWSFLINLNYILFVLIFFNSVFLFISVYQVILCHYHKEYHSPYIILKFQFYFLFYFGLRIKTHNGDVKPGELITKANLEDSLHRTRCPLKWHGLFAYEQEPNNLCRT